MRSLQLDSRSLWAERTRQRAVDAARRIGAEELATVLEDWDLTIEPRSLGPAPFFAWLYRLRALIAADELGEDAAFPAFALRRCLKKAMLRELSCRSGPMTYALPESKPLHN